MFKHKIELITTADIMDFVRIATEESGAVWKSLYCESENDIYTSISKYCVE